MSSNAGNGEAVVVLLKELVDQDLPLVNAVIL